MGGFAMSVTVHGVSSGTTFVIHPSSFWQVLLIQAATISVLDLLAAPFRPTVKIIGCHSENMVRPRLQIIGHELTAHKLRWIEDGTWWALGLWSDATSMWDVSLLAGGEEPMFSLIFGCRYIGSPKISNPLE